LDLDELANDVEKAFVALIPSCIKLLPYLLAGNDSVAHETVMEEVDNSDSVGLSPAYNSLWKITAFFQYCVDKIMVVLFKIGDTTAKKSSHDEILETTTRHLLALRKA